MTRVRYHGSIVDSHGEGECSPYWLKPERYVIVLDNGQTLINVGRESFTILGDDDARNEVPDVYETG